MEVASVTKVLFFAYFAILILVSMYAYNKRKKAKNFQEEYYVAGRSFGPWIVAFVWATSWTSGGTFIGTPSVYYTYGWCTILWQAGAAILGICGMLMIGRRIARFASDNNCVTLPDLFAERFNNRTMGIIAACSIIVFGIAYMVSQYTAAARILQTFFGLDFTVAILVFAAVTAIYTVVGGIRGVAYNALVQGIIMLGGSLIICIIMVTKAGGLSAITQAQMSLDPALLTPPGPKNYLPLATGFSTFFTLGVAVMAQPHVVTRIFTVKDTNALKRAGALISMISGFVTLIALYLLPIPTNLLGFNPLIWGLVVSALVMVFVSKATKITNPELVEAIFR